MSSRHTPLTWYRPVPQPPLLSADNSSLNLLHIKCSTFLCFTQGQTLHHLLIVLLLCLDHGQLSLEELHTHTQQTMFSCSQHTHRPMCSAFTALHYSCRNYPSWLSMHLLSCTKSVTAWFQSCGVKMVKVLACAKLMHWRFPGHRHAVAKVFRMVRLLSSC